MCIFKKKKRVTNEIVAAIKGKPLLCGCMFIEMSVWSCLCESSEHRGCVNVIFEYARSCSEDQFFQLSCSWDQCTCHVWIKKQAVGGISGLHRGEWEIGKGGWKRWLSRSGVSVCMHARCLHRCPTWSVIPAALDVQKGFFLPIESSSFLWNCLPRLLFCLSTSWSSSSLSVFMFSWQGRLWFALSKYVIVLTILVKSLWWTRFRHVICVCVLSL